MKSKKEKNIIIACTIIILLSVIGYFGVTYFLNKDVEKQEQKLQNIIDNYGTVEKEPISTTIAKFNTEIMNNNVNKPAREDYLTIDNNQYWYGLYDDIYCYVIPEKFTGNKDVDITKLIAIYYPKKTKNEALALEYVKHLIKANNNNLTNAEIKELITEAKKLSKDKKTANNRKGIFVGILETETHFEYQVTRNFSLDKA